MKPNSQCGPPGDKGSTVRRQTLKQAALLLQVSSSRNFERMVAAPKAVCSSLDAEMWRARNDVVVRFHSGQIRTLPLRETEWYLFDCNV